MILDHKNGRNLLDKEALLEVFDVYDRVLATSSDGGNRGYDERSCAVNTRNPAQPCLMRRPVIASTASRPCAIDAITYTHTGQKSGILAFWGWDRATLEADTDIIATINRDDVPDCCSGAGPFVVLGQNAGKISRDDAGLVTSIGTLQLNFYLNAKTKKGGRDKKNRELEKEFDKIRTRAPTIIWISRSNHLLLLLSPRTWGGL